MQPVTKCFAKAFDRQYAGPRRTRNSDLSTYYKRHAHRRLRTAERRYLAAGDWDAGIEPKPVTGWDVD